MKIDHCLILSAGFGTRMGEIGKKLPKVLWPIFEKSLIQIQIDYALLLGCRNIYINTHYGHDKVIDHLKNVDYLKYVSILNESTILGVGGAIHNLAALKDIDYNGNLLTLNADQFFFMPKLDLLSNFSTLDDYTNILFGLKVKSNSGYGQVLVENDLMKGIIAEDTVSDYFTYSGVGLTNLSKLKRVEGVSRFFDSVADFENSNVKFITGLNVDYWDFGTLRRYYDSMFSLIDIFSEKNSKSHSAFVQFLQDIDAVDLGKISKDCYGTRSGEKVILMGAANNDAGSHQNAIIIDQDKSALDITVKSGIYYHGILEQF